MSENDSQQTPAAPATPPAPQNTDRGFPEGTPVAEMSQEQQTAYWKHHARKHESTVKGFEGLTPQQVAEMKTRLETLETEKLSADEKALKTARTEASTAATEAVKAEYLPKLQAAEVKAIAAEVVKGDQLATFMRIANPAAFVGDDGQIDEAKVMGELTSLFGQTPPQQQRWQNAGQYAPPPPPGRPGESGRAEAARRFGTQSK